MWRMICAALVGGLMMASGPARAQSGHTNNEIKKLQAEIELLKASIKEAEEKLNRPGGKEGARPGPPFPPKSNESPFPGGLPKEGDQPNPKFDGGPKGRPFPPKGNEGPGPEEGPMPRPKEGPGSGGGAFGGRKFGGRGFGGALGGPGGTAGGFGGEIPNDVKGLEDELRRLHNAAQMIQTRAKEIEARLMEAKKVEARKMEAEMKRNDRLKKDSGGSSSEVEKRLDRIEQTLEEIQKELRRKR